MSKKFEKLTTPQLIRKAYLNIEDENIYWEYIHILRKRGSKEVFYKTKKLVYSRDALSRQLSADILAQFGYKTKLFRGECVYLLGKLFTDKNEYVVTEAIYGLSYRKTLSYHKKLAQFATHASDNIREAVAHALGGMETTEAINALILLMKDKNDEVRNWSTFSLAQITETNTKKICDALFENLDDKEQEVRGEALLGLASRKDKRVKEVILEDLQRPFYGSWIFDSIVEMPDSRYLQYFDTYIDSLDNEDKKAFKRDIEKARLALMETI